MTSLPTPDVSPQAVSSHTETLVTSRLEILRQWVSVNSFTQNPAGIQTVGELTAHAFEKLGFKAEFIPDEDPSCGKHLVLTRKGTCSRQVALVGHLDTVFPEEEERKNNFFWRPLGNKIYGPGTVDMKAGNLLILMMLEVFAKFFPDEFEQTTWVVLFNSREEMRGDEFARICEARLKGKTLAAFVFEPGKARDQEYSLLKNRKGKAKFRVRVEGKASHAGSSHGNGASAITQLAHTIQKISTLTHYEKGITFNVGTISGGVNVNRVPHHAEAEVEMRAYNKEDYQAAKSAILALQHDIAVKSHNGGHPCQVRIEPFNEVDPWSPNPESDRLYELWSGTAAELGWKITCKSGGGLSDANTIWKYVPTLDALGADGGNLHCSEQTEDLAKEQEFMYPGCLVPKTTLNVLSMAKLLRNA
jgi:glutamate carboxypeptidase